MEFYEDCHVKMLADADLKHYELGSVLMEWECRQRGASILQMSKRLFIADFWGVSLPFYRSMGPNVSVPAEKITINKDVTKRILSSKGMNVPEGGVYDGNMLSQA